MDVMVNYDVEAIAHTKDIGEGGICLITEEPFEDGRMLDLVFLFPDYPEKIECFGKVVWSRQATEHLWENGVSIWEITEENNDRLRECLEAKSESG